MTLNFMESWTLTGSRHGFSSSPVLRISFSNRKHRHPNAVSFVQPTMMILPHPSPHLLPIHGGTHRRPLAGAHLPARVHELRRGRGGRRGTEVGAFWQDPSKPMAVEMEPLKDVDQLEEILGGLRREEDGRRAVVVDWMAAWCRKCIFLKPKLEKLAADFPRVKFYYVDVNKVSQALVKRGNISKMPTIQLWRDGEMKAEVIGGHKAWLVVDEVREMIQKHS